MSEYQCYEFVALDRPLTSKEMSALRAISSRAEITPTRFWNEYHWGDLQADPAKLVQRYFDAHLYFASWGTHRLMLRVPNGRVDATRYERVRRASEPRRHVRVDHAVRGLVDLARSGSARVEAAGCLGGGVR
jgi:hypothetical protein